MRAPLEHAKSHALFAAACQLIPGGVNSPARAFGAVGGEPVFMERGEGAYLYDVDGNTYLDFVQSWGPMILGHAHPDVVAALQAALLKGTGFGTPTEAENDLASLIVDAVPCIEKIRLVNSGTEATMSAIRLARGYTGRDKILKFIGNYHGHVDSLLVAAGSAGATFSVPDSPGITPGTTRDTILLHFNDVDGVKRVFKECGHEIAAVIVEPVAGNMGCVAGSSNFLYELRHRTAESGTVLIFDEVMCGFRVGYGGAQARFSITPDLTTLGKVIGGGLPVGAYGGTKAIMDHVLPLGPVFQAGTLSGNPLACAAGIATLKVLRDTNPYPALERKAAYLAEGLEDEARAAGIPVYVSQWGTMLTLFFLRHASENKQEVADRIHSKTFSGSAVEKTTATSTSGNCVSEKIVDWRTASNCDTERYAVFFRGMLQRGIYLPCSQYEAMFISNAMTDADIETTLNAAKEVFATFETGAG
ncbi:MAG TPA: aspartate aminotransferase family protein [Planctomycetaceae bacterium]|nr:aspartate aminotransferase family protein [Planctomycetaceae bacterium]